jgi:sarcosine oxidase subunit beta
LDAGIAHGWAGRYEVTPDHNALIGEAGTPSRFRYATGFLQGPAVGEVVRDLYPERRSLCRRHAVARGTVRGERD